jgi:hypothetical protein
MLLSSSRSKAYALAGRCSGILERILNTGEPARAATDDFGPDRVVLSSRDFLAWKPGVVAARSFKTPLGGPFIAAADWRSSTARLQRC